MYKSMKQYVVKLEIFLSEFFFKLAPNGQSDKAFLLTSNFCLKGLSAPAMGLYTCIKSLKNVYKNRLQRDVFETLEIFIAPGLYTFIKS